MQKHGRGNTDSEEACQRGHWPVSSVSETRIIWNITAQGNEQGYDEIKNWKYGNWGQLILIDVCFLMS
jgi:hypothetical protein